MLEATVRKQALQLSQIKKQKSSGDGGAAHMDYFVDTHHQEEATDQVWFSFCYYALSSKCFNGIFFCIDQTDQEDDEDDWENDALFQKLRKVTEHMIEQGQKSIDFEYKILGRVLSNYNVMDEEAEDEDEDGDEEEKVSGEQNETAFDQGKERE